MPNQEIVEFIKSQRTNGTSDGETKEALKRAGWNESDIDDAFFVPLEHVPTPQMPATPIETTHVPEAMDIVREAISVFKTHWLQLVGFTLTPALIGFILGIILIPTSVGVSFLLYQQPSVTEKMILAMIALPIVAVIVSFLQMWSFAAILVRIRDRDQTLGFKEIWAISLKYAWPLLVVAFLTSFIIGGGMMLFIIPGILFAIWFIFSSIIVVFDEERGMNALLKSKAYVSGMFGTIISRWVVILLIAIVLAIGSALVTSLLWENTLSLAILQILQTPVNFVASAIGTIFSVLLFGYIKNIKGTFDFVAKTSTKIWLFVSALAGILLFLILSGAIILVAINSSSNIFSSFFDQSDGTSQIEDTNY